MQRNGPKNKGESHPNLMCLDAYLNPLTYRLGLCLTRYNIGVNVRPINTI
jgi:hypothetical protein